MITLVLGGARSGKSRHAEGLAAGFAARTYIATAETFDDEMRQRAARHQLDRGCGWRTLEAPYDLIAALKAADGPGGFILIDCVTLWLNNLMYVGREVAEEVAALAAALPAVRARLEPCSASSASVCRARVSPPLTPSGPSFASGEWRQVVQNTISRMRGLAVPLKPC